MTDKEQIKDTVESVHRYRDHAMWERVEDFFVANPYVDDSEITKELPGIRSVKDLVASWRRELKSYFYATRHKIQSMRIFLNGSKEAQVSTPVLGQYFLTDRGERFVLTINGIYRYDLVKKGDKWKIKRTEFKLKDQSLKSLTSR